MHIPRKPTEWNRRTLQKAKPTCVSEAEVEAPEGAWRSVRLILTGGACSFRILDADMNPIDETAAGRTYMWMTLFGPTDRVEIPLLPHQVLWAQVSNQKGISGIEEFSVIVSYHGGTL